MAQLTLARHTTPDIEPGTCYGRLDIGVKPSFETEARTTVERLVKPEIIVTSPLRRCQTLAAYIADAMQLTFSVDARLTEMDFGHWEGQAWSEIPRHELDAWAADFLDAAPHGGESVRALNDRVAQRLAEDRQAGHATLWVTHAGVIKAARYLAADAPADFDWQASVDFGHTLELI